MWDDFIRAMVWVGVGALRPPGGARHSLAASRLIYAVRFSASVREGASDVGGRFGEMRGGVFARAPLRVISLLQESFGSSR